MKEEEPEEEEEEETEEEAQERMQSEFQDAYGRDKDQVDDAVVILNGISSSLIAVAMRCRIQRICCINSVVVISSLLLLSRFRLFLCATGKTGGAANVAH